ncbi:MAG: ABC transporter permease [Promethearchaeota archaeon]
MKVNLKRELQGCLAITKKDIRIYYVKGPVLIFGILFPFFLFLAFSVGRNLPPQVLVPGMISLTIFFTSSSVTPVIAPWERRTKTFERLISTPLSLNSILIGDIIASLFFGTVLVVIPICIGVIIFGASIFNLLALIISIPLSGFCFASLGILFSTVPTDNPSEIMTLSNLVRLPLIFISGVFIPIEQLPIWGQIIAAFSPLTFAHNLNRYAFEVSLGYNWSVDALILLCFTLILFIAALKLHKRTLEKE